MPRWVRAAIPALAASLGAGVITAILLSAAARWFLPDVISGPVAEGAWTKRSRALFLPTGFHPPEFDGDRERHFSWTTGNAALEFTDLSRTLTYRLTLTVDVGRPAGTPPPVVRILVDDRLALTRTLEGGPIDLAVDVPPGARSGASVAIDVSPLFEPGGGDRRSLGILVHRVSLAARDGGFRPTINATMSIAGAVALVALGFFCLGLGRGVIALVTGAVAAGAVWLALQDAAFAGVVFGDRFLHIALFACGISIVGGAVRWRWPTLGGVPEWPLALAIVLAAVIVKMALFWHPSAIVGDGLFQVHRAQVVHGGTYFFTSITPRPFFEFPYPIALYVTVLPFWGWFPTELDLLRLLRAACIIADSAVALALFAAIRRGGWPRGAAIAAAALWPFARAPFEALFNANLTNLFGQAVFAIALAGVAGLAVARPSKWFGWLPIAALFFVGFLSHFGTVTVGLAILGATSLTLIVIGRDWQRTAGIALAAATLVAVLAAWFAYYSHPTFREVYAKSYASVTAGDRDDSSKIVASPIVKFGRWWAGSGDDYGRPGVGVLLASLIGFVIALRTKPRDGLTLVFGGWLLAWLALTLLGIFSPLTLRANLAAAPAFLFFSAIAVGALMTRDTPGRAAALLLALWIVWDGWQIALRSLALAA